MFRLSEDDEISSESEEEKEKGRIRVTTLVEPRSITIGPQGTSVDSSSSIHNSRPSSTKPPVEVRLLMETWSKNGSTTPFFWWSQDRKEVVLRTKLDANTKASNVNILVVAAVESHIYGKSSLNVSLTLPSGESSSLFGGILRYPITTNDISDGDCAVDWELRPWTGDDHYKMLEITLKKMSPIANSIIWWKSVFDGDPEIDVMSIEGRFVPGNTVSQTADTRKSISNFDDAWVEAHMQFKQKIASMKDHEISVNVEGDEGDAVDEEQCEGKKTETSLKRGGRR